MFLWLRTNERTKVYRYRKHSDFVIVDIVLPDYVLLKATHIVFLKYVLLSGFENKN
jgi:hypothetical protein